MKTAREIYWDRIIEVAAKYMKVTNRRLDEAKDDNEHWYLLYGKLHGCMQFNYACYSETFRKATETLG